jgi:hypothetical protein
MDWTSIVVAALACVGTASGSLYGIRKSTSLIEYRLQMLENKVDKHNGVIDRTYKVEECLKICDERIKVANHRIDDLEAGK